MSDVIFKRKPNRNSPAIIVTIAEIAMMIIIFVLIFTIGKQTSCTVLRRVLAVVAGHFSIFPFFCTHTTIIHPVSIFQRGPVSVQIKNKSEPVTGNEQVT